MGSKITAFIALFGFFSLGSALAQPIAHDHKTYIDSVRSFTFQYITTNPSKAFDELSAAEQMADSLNYYEARADLLGKLSISVGYLGNWDESVNYRLESIRLYETLGMNLEAGYGFAELGYGARRRDMERAEYFMSRGIQILEDFPTSTELANAYNNYAVIKLEQGKTDSAIILVNKSLDIKIQNKDTLGIAYSYGYLGTAYQELQEYERAIDYLKHSFDLKTQLKDSSGMAVDLTNIAAVYREQEDFKRAAENFRASLDMALQINFHHLAEHNFNSLAGLYESQAKYDSALHYQKQFTSFRENRVNESTNARLAELEVQFETEQKEKELALKQAELSQEKLKVRQRNWILSLLGGLLLIGGFITGLFIRHQKMKTENLERENDLKMQLANAEMENKIHQERERISRDLHDNVGSQISNLITGIEIGNLHLEKAQQNEAARILSTLDVDARSAMTDLRETIWLLDKDEIAFTIFQDHIKDYLGKQQQYLKGMKTEVLSSIEQSFTLKPTQSLNLMRIIQEALNNAKKYAAATCFQVKFDLTEKGLEIIIRDNGIGLDIDSSKNNGHGLKNMRERAASMNAEFSLESSPGQGTKITLNLPQIP